MPPKSQVVPSGVPARTTDGARDRDDRLPAFDAFMTTVAQER